MKIIFIALYARFNDKSQKPLLLAHASNMSAFSIFTRSTILEHVQFASRLIVERVEPGARVSVRKNDDKVPFIVHCHVKKVDSSSTQDDDNDDDSTTVDGTTDRSLSGRTLGAIVVSDTEYPQKTAYALMNKFMSRHMTMYPRCVASAQVDDKTNSPQHLKTSLADYQNPSAANDELNKVNDKLKDVKSIMDKNMTQMLSRGEDLDEMMDKSQELSKASKMFYKQSKKANSCCRYG